MVVKAAPLHTFVAASWPGDTTSSCACAVMVMVPMQLPQLNESESPDELRPPPSGPKEAPDRAVLYARCGSRPDDRGPPGVGRGADGRPLVQEHQRRADRKRANPRAAVRTLLHERIARIDRGTRGVDDRDVRVDRDTGGVDDRINGRIGRNGAGGVRNACVAARIAALARAARAMDARAAAGIACGSEFARAGDDHRRTGERAPRWSSEHISWQPPGRMRPAA